MKIVFVLTAMMFSGAVFASKPYSVQGIMLLQPDFVLKERVEVDELSDYIKSVNAAAETSLARISRPDPTAGFIVVAVRPGGQSKVWLDFSPGLPHFAAAQLRSALERVTPFKAKGGVVVFAINTTLWGAAATERQAPSPVEWREAMKGSSDPMEVGDLVDRVWPAKAGT